MTVDAGFSVVGHIGVTLRVNERVRTHTHGQAEGNAQNNSGDQAKPHDLCFPLSRAIADCQQVKKLLLLSMTLSALKHGNVTEVYRMFERFVGFVAGIAFPISQGAQIDRVLKGASLNILSRGAR